MIKKIIFFIFASVLVLFLLIILQSVDPEQQNSDISTHDFPDSLVLQHLDLDSLKAVVGDSKGLPKGFEKAALIAYSAYPELKDVRIDMVLTEIGAPMESNFDIATLFGSGKNRVYKILLNDAVNTNFDPILLRSLPFSFSAFKNEMILSFAQSASGAMMKPSSEMYGFSFDVFATTALNNFNVFMLLIFK